MASTFPPELREYLCKVLDKTREDIPGWTPFEFLQSLAGFHGDGGSYSFVESLRSGHYVHYDHEAHDFEVTGYNCTTIIPTMYVHAKELGFNPRIVQFKGFRSVSTKHDKGTRKDPATHFSLIVDVGRKQPYLLDVFHNIFGPIIEEGDGYVCVGKTKGFKYKRREFDEMNNISEEDFVKMMERFRDPADSLDMLVAGQRVHRYVTVEKVDHCDHKVLYDDKTNTVSFRVVQSPPCIGDRAITMRHVMDDEGRTLEKKIDLSFIKGKLWNTLVGENKLATVTFADLQRLRRDLKPYCDIMKRPRYGVVAYEHPEVHEILREFAASQGVKTGTDALNCIDPRKMKANVIYQWLLPKGPEYFSTNEQRDGHIRGLYITLQELNSELRPLHRELYLNGWKLDRLERNQARNLRRKKKKLTKERSVIINELDSLNRLREKQRAWFDRLVDQMFFARELLNPGSHSEEIPQLAEVHGLESRDVFELVAGDNMNDIFQETYSCVVLDLAPSVLAAKRYLDPKHFIEPMRPKIKARRARRTRRDELQFDF